MAEWRWRYAADTRGMEDDQPLETEVDLRNGQNPPLETEIDLRGGARMFFWTARQPAQDVCGIARGHPA